VPTRISYLKGIDKILEQRHVFQNALQLEQRQGNLGEREMVEPVDDCKCHI